jgi:ABC-type lipoprotein export system ATPase subunit
MVTHDPKAAGRAHRLVHLDKGVLKEDVKAAEGSREVGMAAASAAAVGK